MPRNSDVLIRTVLGQNLQTGALRAVLLLAAFAALGTIATIILR